MRGSGRWGHQARRSCHWGWREGRLWRRRKGLLRLLGVLRWWWLLWLLSVLRRRLLRILRRRREPTGWGGWRKARHHTRLWGIPLLGVSLLRHLLRRHVLLRRHGQRLRRHGQRSWYARSLRLWWRSCRRLGILLLGRHTWLGVLLRLRLLRWLLGLLWSSSPGCVPLLKCRLKGMHLCRVVGADERLLFRGLVREQRHGEREVVPLGAAKQLKTCCISGSVVWRN